MGRMDEPNSERIITPMSKSLLEAVDDFRFKNRIASRAEAIRTLLLVALNVIPETKKEAKDRPKG